MPDHGKKMQGFPKNFFLSNARTSSMKLLGNSVAVNAVKHVSLEMMKYMYDKDKFILRKVFKIK